MRCIREHRPRADVLDERGCTGVGRVERDVRARRLERADDPDDTCCALWKEQRHRRRLAMSVPKNRAGDPVRPCIDFTVRERLLLITHCEALLVGNGHQGEAFDERLVQVAR